MTRRPARLLLALVGLAAVVYGGASLTGGWLGEPPWWVERTSVTRGMQQLTREHARSGRELISTALIVAGLGLLAGAGWWGRDRG